MTLTQPPRYPDPHVHILDESFRKYRLYAANIERLATGLRWAEGPVWFGDGRYLLVSDIPNNRVMRWDAPTGNMTEFRSPSNYANGQCRDTQGRLISCEHLTRRITRTEYDGSITVLCDSYQGKRLNSPNDVVCHADGSIWFTDPPFGIGGHYEGERAASELPHAVYRISTSGDLVQVITDLAGPNGLAFSPDYKQLYVVESRATPSRKIVRYDMNASGNLTSKTDVIDAAKALAPALGITPDLAKHGAIDGIAVDTDGNIWCGWGTHNGADTSTSALLDGVMVFNPEGTVIGFIQLPERCANLCFGGPKKNRLFMAASTSLYALYVEVIGL